MTARPTQSGKGSAVSPARREAFAILLALAHGKAHSPGSAHSGEAHSDDLLRSPRVSALSAQDRHLCTALVLGVLRWLIYLDRRIRPLLAKPNARLEDEVSIALRLGAFQLWFLDRIPAHAAIGESVALAKNAGHRFASGMVNAVLRKAAALGREESLDAQEALPSWLVERWTALYGEEATRKICGQAQTAPETTLRLSAETMEVSLAAEGVACAPGMLLKAARRVIAGDVTATEAFRSGRARIQEEGSQLIAELSASGGFSPQRILDCCAAPGGKTLVLSEINPQASVTACELSQRRFAALRTRINAIAATGVAAGMQNAPSSRIDLMLGDITRLAFEDHYDFVLADVPCSGTGTLGRNPEIRHRLALDDLARHHQRQCAILRAALNAAKPGGRVVYSTCSLEPEENEAVITELLSQTPGWRPIPLKQIIASLCEKGRITAEGLALLQQCVRDDGSLLLLPGSLGSEHANDGFFMAMLERASA